MINVVLFSSDYLPKIGGVATHVHELARALTVAGQQVCVVAPRDSSWRQPATWLSRHGVTNGIKTVEPSLASLPRGWGQHWRVCRYVKRLLRTLSRHCASIVLHCHDYEAYGHYVAQHCPQTVRIFTNHTSTFLQDFDNPATHAQLRRNLDLYDWIITPSQELADRTAALGYPADRITFIPNGVDTERFRPEPSLRDAIRCELGIPPNHTVLLCARRVVPKNGVIDFAHSLRFLAQYVTQTTVLFAGNQYSFDSYERETMAAAKHSPLGPSVRFLGPVPNAEIHRLYTVADIAILPSLKEATSISGLEAMASGVPLVATRVGGIRHLVDHEVDGLLVEPGDPRDLARAITQLIANPNLVAEFGRRARQKVCQHFSWTHIAARTAGVYQQAAPIASLRRAKTPPPSHTSSPIGARA